MLGLLGVFLVGAGFLILIFTRRACQRRPDSFLASEAGVLVILAPASLILFAGGAMSIAKFIL